MSQRQIVDLILLGALWGASFLFMRVAVPEFGVVALIEGRVLIGALFLLPLLLIKHDWRHELKGHWWDMLVVGVLNSALPFSLLAFALIYMTSGMGAIFNSTVPMFAAVVAYVWLGERIAFARVLGIILGIVGVVVLVWGKVSLNADSGLGMLWAIIAALIATLSYSVSATYARLHLTGFPSLITSTVSLMMASLVLLPLTLMFWPAQMPSLLSWLCLVALGIGSTGLAYIMYFRLITEIGSSKAVTVTFIVPIFATLWGMIFLHEPLTMQMLFGGGVIILGTALATGILQLGRSAV